MERGPEGEVRGVCAGDGAEEGCGEGKNMDFSGTCGFMVRLPVPAVLVFVLALGLVFVLVLGLALFSLVMCTSASPSVCRAGGLRTCWLAVAVACTSAHSEVKSDTKRQRHSAQKQHGAQVNTARGRAHTPMTRAWRRLR